MRQTPHPFPIASPPRTPQPDPDDLLITWGCLNHGVRLGNIGTHFLVIGTTGSGKSNIIKMLANSVLCDGAGDLRYRGIIYDPKREMLPFLARLDVPDERVVVTNPYDARCAAWDMAADIREPGDAEAIARAIIPLPEDSDRRDENVFFTNAANQTLTAIIEALAALAPRNWDFRDVTEACSNPTMLKQVLRATASGRDTLSSYYKPYDKTAKNVFATVRTYIGQYTVLASLWHNAKHRFSMDDWLDGRAILVLGSRPRREGVVRLANSLFMQRAIELVVDREEGREHDLSWFFLDELREAGRFPKLSLLLNQGRSKGARVVIGYQDHSGMTGLLGEHAAEELASQCGNKAILNLASATSMQWASDLCSKEPQARTTHTYTDEGAHSTSTTLDYVEAVPPIRFKELPLASNHGGAITAYFVQSEHPTFLGHMTAAEVDEAMPPKRPAADLPPAFLDRPIEHQERRPWDDADFRRLGLTPVPADGPDDDGREPPGGGQRLRTMDDFE